VTLVEKERDIGGWPAHRLGRLRFDYGPHSFTPNDQEVIDFYRSLLPDRFRRKIRVRLYIFSQLVSYPLVGFDVLKA